MTLPAWREEPIAKKHNRRSFDCGEPDLNEFLWRYARQSHERGGAKTFVAVDNADGQTVHGYYSLSPACIEYARTPEVVRRGLGRYEIGAYRLSRLAVSAHLHKQGLGGQLLLAAGRRCLRVAKQAGGVVMLIDAKNDRAAEWYAGYGAMPLMDTPRSLVLPLASIEAALNFRVGAH